MLDYIHANKHDLTMRILIDVMRQLAQVMSYLHDKQLVLCSLTPENISVDAADENQVWLPHSHAAL